MRFRQHHVVVITLLGIMTLLFQACGSTNLNTPLSQTTPSGTVLLFKQRLDSNDVNNAARLMAHPSGRTFLAVELYEIRDEVARLQRVFTKSRLTDIKSSECSEQQCRLIVEFDYNNKYSVQTARIGDRWFITAIGDSTQQDD